MTAPLLSGNDEFCHPLCRRVRGRPANKGSTVKNGPNPSWIHHRLACPDLAPLAVGSSTLRRELDLAEEPEASP
jgi:hypothetical protein